MGLILLLPLQGSCAKLARTPSGTGGQLSLFGLAGIAAGIEEGVEVNVLGLTFGIDPKSLSLKLPLIGPIGPKSRQEYVTLRDYSPPVAATPP